MAACRGCGTPLEGRRQKCDDCKAGLPPAEPPPPLTIREAADLGNRRTTLEALVRALGDAIHRCQYNQPEKLGPLSRQLRDTMRELESLPNPEAVEPVDDLAARRARRQSDAAHQASS